MKTYLVRNKNNGDPDGIYDEKQAAVHVAKRLEADCYEAELHRIDPETGDYLVTRKRRPRDKRREP